MIIGNILIIVALCATIFSAWQYFRIERYVPGEAAKYPRERSIARYGFIVSTVAVAIAAVILLYALLTHQFQVAYVSQYSSLDLPLGYLISAFWAGQQGTFLLWVLLTAIMGLVFMRKAGQFEHFGMIFLNIIQVSLLAILVKRSPFELLPQVPPNGSGLNPLLQNPWMVIHPPILFIGYASMAFPFVIALAALSRREYGSWIHKALPWVLFTAVMLGAGIVIGGFWAYEVLGWGGYWGWDPVENSSLIPWLTILALIHGLLIQKNRGALQRTNFFLAIISFILVVYATFLTRSGILADFSVHSFQDLGINLYLIIFIVITLLFGGGLLVLRLREIPAARIDSSTLNRQIALYISMGVLCASALSIWAGTSLPIITKLLGKISQVDVTYYTKVNLPIGILMAMLLGITPWLMWKEEGYFSAYRRLAAPFVFGVLTALLSWFAGITTIGFLFFILMSGFALATNFGVVLRNWKAGWITIGAPLSHVGVALMLIGINISGQLATTERAVLTRNIQGKILGFTFLYSGTTTGEDGKDRLMMKFSVPGGGDYSAAPRLYFNAASNGLMREPDIKSLPLMDIYISPLEKPDQGRTEFVLKKGESGTFGKYLVLFEDYELGKHGSPDSIRIAARLTVTAEGKVTTLSPVMMIARGKRTTEPTPLPQISSSTSSAFVSLEGVNVTEKSVQLAVTDEMSDQVIVEVSKKPFMNVLWLGTVIMIAGVGIAIGRRLQHDPLT
jgi:cytochrome c-type biogenesis protein CcmF